jgi:hypothetical protein
VQADQRVEDGPNGTAYVARPVRLTTTADVQSDILAQYSAQKLIMVDTAIPGAVTRPVRSPVIRLRPGAPVSELASCAPCRGIVSITSVSGGLRSRSASTYAVTSTPVNDETC